MKKMSMMILSTSVVLAVSAKVHKFSPEFQAVYDASTAPEVQEAQRKGAKAKIIYRVVDDEGAPITNTVVHGTWQNDYPRKTWKENFVTDDKGVFVAKGKVGGRFSCHIWKDGYYSSCAGVNFHWREGISPLVKDGKWQPYGEEKTIILKRKKNPIDLKWHTWGIGGYNAPATNEWIGLDFEKGQWCAPYGAGEHKDVLVRFSGVVIDDFTWDTKTEVSFTNVPYAGYYEMSKDVYSEMKSCYAASTNNASYIDRTMTFVSHGARGISPNSQTTDKLAEYKYVVFRTRCVVDDKGKLVSAHYGKLMGEFNGGFMALGFRCAYGDQCGIFFNPTPNDHNLEDMETINRLKLLGR